MGDSWAQYLWPRGQRPPLSAEELVARRPAPLNVAMDLDETKVALPTKSARVIRSILPTRKAGP